MKKLKRCSSVTIRGLYKIISVIKEFTKKILRGLITIRFCERILNFMVTSKNGIIIYYNDPKRSKVINLAKKIKNETDLTLLNYNEIRNNYKSIFIKTYCFNQKSFKSFQLSLNKVEGQQIIKSLPRSHNLVVR